VPTAPAPLSPLPWPTPSPQPCNLLSDPRLRPPPAVAGPAGRVRAAAAARRGARLPAPGAHAHRGGPPRGAAASARHRQTPALPPHPRCRLRPRHPPVRTCRSSFLCRAAACPPEPPNLVSSRSAPRAAPPLHSGGQRVQDCGLPVARLGRLAAGARFLAHLAPLLCVLWSGMGSRGCGCGCESGRALHYIAACTTHRAPLTQHALLLATHARDERAT
jgi:hypothetical protein